MNTLIMPGFTAEASVYASTTRYRSMAVGLQGVELTAEASVYASTTNFRSMARRLQDEGTVVPLPEFHYCLGFHACGPCEPSHSPRPGLAVRFRKTCWSNTCIPTFNGGCSCDYNEYSVDCKQVLTQGR